MGTSVSNAQSLCASGPPQGAEHTRAAPTTEGASAVAVGLRRTEASTADAQDGANERRLPECTNGNGCGQCLRALAQDECPADLAKALAANPNPYPNPDPNPNPNPNPDPYPNPYPNPSPRSTCRKHGRVASRLPTRGASSHCLRVRSHSCIWMKR